MTNYDSLGTGVFTYLDCSTIHITEKDDTYLQTLSESATQLPTRLLLYAEVSSWQDYGYWIYADLDGQTAQELEISESLFNVCEFAVQKGCMWLRLSPDGTQFDGLTRYDW